MKKKMKVKLVVVVAIAAVMMLSSYAAALSQDEIAGLMLNASEVDTYKFDMNMNMNMTMTTEMLMGNETNATEMAIKVNGSGERDYVNESLWMAMNINVNTSENEGEDTNMNAILSMLGIIDMEMYLINNTVYSKVDLGIPFMPVLWITMERPLENNTYNNTYNNIYNNTYNESLWASKDQLELQKELLNCSNVTLLDDAEVNGVDCYVLKIVPDEKCWESIMNQSKMLIKLSPGMEMQNTSDIANQSISNITITEWIANDTMFVMKSVAAMDMTTTSPDTEEEAKVAMDYTITFDDYNVPVTIVLPPEAEGAMDIDISDLLGMLPGGN